MTKSYSDSWGRTFTIYSDDPNKTVISIESGDLNAFEIDQKLVPVVCFDLLKNAGYTTEEGTVLGSAMRRLQAWISNNWADPKKYEFGKKLYENFCGLMNDSTSSVFFPFRKWEDLSEASKKDWVALIDQTREGQS